MLSATVQSLIMPNILPVFDHLTLNARDELTACADALEAMGFHLTPPSYSNIGAVNRCIVLEGAYLEAIAINPLAQLPRQELMQQPVGLNAIVFRTEDADASYADLVTRGFPVLPVQPFSRMAKNSKGEDCDVSFRVVRFESSWGAEAFAFGRVYFCQHLNPDVVFDAGFVRHDNACRAFEALTIEVTNLDKLSFTMKRLFGSAWSANNNLATLRTQALDIHFVLAAHDRITICEFRKTVHALSAEGAKAQDAVKPSTPQIFENSYGRFTF
jgi:hypothetical protein